MKKETIDRNKYNRIHYWLRMNYGQPKKCSNKNCKGISSYVGWALKRDKEYDYIRDNFIPLCKSCHTAYDITDETRQKMRLSRLGKKNSKTTRARISKSNFNKDMSYLCKKVYIYKNDALVKEFDSVSECSKWLKASVSNVSMAMNPKYYHNKTVKGYELSRIKR